MNSPSKVLLAAAGLLLSQLSVAQLTVDVNMSPDQMVQNLVGEGVLISNVVVTAADSSYAYYYATGTELGTSEGLLLTTGLAQGAIGPNNTSGLPQLGPGGVCLTCNLYDNNFGGSALLDLFSGYDTFDATMVEFDIVPQGDSLRFSYTFASEEYQEWVGSPFNDVFGFFISGPNVGADVNIALIPGTSQAVAINSVNHLQNTQYYFNNQSPPGQLIQYDGFTLDLIALVGNLVPCETYHLKLIIADGSDRIYDSAVFINSIESNPVIVASATAGGIPFMIEGCNDGTITFTREESSTLPQTVTYFVGGSATNGLDYTPQLGDGAITDPVTIVIPAGEISVSLDLEAIFDGIPEGEEYITIYLANPLCNNEEILDSISFYIHDELTVDIQPDASSICAGECVQLTSDAINEGSAIFAWSPTTGLNDSLSISPLACPLITTTYTITSIVSECIATDDVTITVSGINLTLDISNVQCSVQATGSIDLTINAGIEPFDILWTGPNFYSSSDEDISDLQPGEYCVTVTDANGCVATSCVTLIQENELMITGATFSDYTCQPISCFGACDGSISIDVAGGVAPYQFNWTGPDFFSDSSEEISGLCAGEYCVTITDAVDCVITACYTLQEPSLLSLELDAQADVQCSGEQTGSICVTASGGCSPYAYAWSHDAIFNAPCAENLPSGIYTVTVTDVNGCVIDEALTIVVSGPQDPLSISTDVVGVYPGGFNVSCPGSSDGFINVTISGGTPAYDVEWLDDNNNLFSTSEDLSGAPCGDYTLNVTDANGCTASMSYNLTCVPPIEITYTVAPNPCGSGDSGLGAIDITSTTGGNGGPYSFQYIGPSCPLGCAVEDLVNVNSGDYVLTVTDEFGCTQTFNINIGTNDDFDVSGVVTPVSCFGACDGDVDITLTPPGSYTTDWYDANNILVSTTEDLVDVCAGIYHVEIVGGACEGTFYFGVVEPEPIDIDVDNLTEPVCFGQNNGCIDISVSGAVGTPDFNWLPSVECFFFGSTDEDICGLFACDYTVEVTDDNGCTVTETISLTAPQVMDIFVETTIFNGGFNISCNGANDGQMSVTVSGGSPDCILFAPDCYNYDWHCDDPLCSVPTNCSGSIQTGLGPGVYCVDVYDANGCLATTTIEMIEPDPIVSNEVVNNVTCNGECDGSIITALGGGSGTFVSINWSGDIGNNLPTATTLTDLCPGTYTLSVFDSNDCEETFTYTITEPEVLEIVVNFEQDITCFGGDDGAVSFEATGGTPDYIYWAEDIDGNQYPGNVIGNLAPGTYTLWAQDANGCLASTPITIDEPEEILLSIEAIIQFDDQVFTLQCNGDCDGALTSTASGGVGTLNYEWENQDGIVIGVEPTLEDLCADNYCLTVTDENGCETEECFEITEPETPFDVQSEISLYAGGFNISCYNACDGSIDLTVSGGVPGYSYQWNCGACGTLDPTEDQASLCADFYEVLVTDANYCDELVQFELTQPDPIIVTTTPMEFSCGYNISCNGECDGTISVEVAGGFPGYAITWEELALVDEYFVDSLCAGTYTICATDDLGCELCSVVTLTEPEVLTVSISDVYDCDNGELELCANISGGCNPYSLFWSSDELSNCITVDEDGNYQVDVTDDNDCEASASITDLVVPEPMDGNVFITSTTCGACNGIIDLQLTGGLLPFTFDWTGTGAVDGQEDQSDLCPGPYSVIVTDQYGCLLDITVTIPSEDGITLQETITGNLCYGSANGSISVIITNAVEPVSITWTDSDGNEIGTGSTISNLEAGTYTLSWSDTEGCFGEEDYIVGQPSSPLVLDAMVSLYDNDYNISVANGTDGSIAIEVSGGTTLYLYVWNPDTGNDTTTVLNNLSAGQYSLTVTDENGCVLDTTFTLIAPEILDFPTGLSPNGDAFNEYYVIVGVEGFPDNEFIVFNRWGNIVYEKPHYENQWYGQNLDGEELPDGTYYIVFRAGDKEFNSYVDLRR